MERRSTKLVSLGNEGLDTILPVGNTKLVPESSTLVPKRKNRAVPENTKLVVDRNARLVPGGKKVMPESK
jgi:hypothetical protein